MNHWVAGNVITPLLERVLGRNTVRLAAQLEGSQWLDRQALRTMQIEKLRTLLEHAREHCPFYRRRFDESGVDPAHVTSLLDLRRLPLLLRRDVAQNRRALSWPDVPGGLIRSNTGGSTGEPLVFYVDRRRQSAFKAARIRAQRWFGVDPGDRQVYLWGAPAELSQQDRLKSFRDWLTNELLLSAFEMSPERMDEYIGRIERSNPTCVFGYPSTLALLCEHTARRGHRMRTPALKAVLVTGELLYDHQRTLIERTFDVRVGDGYGSRDGGFIAHECPAGAMHVTDELTIVELIRPDGLAAEPGQTGEIVVTDLEAYCMPLIRYCTGDLARRPIAERNGCECGRGLSILEMVEGRNTDLLVAPDGTAKHALSLIYVLRDMDSVSQFRIVQQADFSVDIVVVPACPGGLDERDRRRIRKGVAGHMGSDVACRLEEVSAIPPGGSGKHRYVVSHAASSVTPRRPVDARLIGTATVPSS
ncbi:MAG TPA: phenylacetate--CoA ligase family protein [Phycisphaerae bacterium]|nr:phenylacetate--CoA ligase family protein [Phycisphaerae bacterium]